MLQSSRRFISRRVLAQGGPRQTLRAVSPYLIRHGGNLARAAGRPNVKPGATIPRNTPQPVHSGSKVNSENPPEWLHNARNWKLHTSILDKLYENSAQMTYTTPKIGNNGKKIIALDTNNAQIKKFKESMASEGFSDLTNVKPYYKMVTDLNPNFKELIDGNPKLDPKLQAGPDDVRLSLFAVSCWDPTSNTNRFLFRGTEFKDSLKEDVRSTAPIVHMWRWIYGGEIMGKADDIAPGLGLKGKVRDPALRDWRREPVDPKDGIKFASDMEYVKQALDEMPAGDLHIGGHSKGCQRAMITAAYASTFLTSDGKRKFPNIKVANFAGYQIGDAEFIECLRSRGVEMVGLGLDGDPVDFLFRKLEGHSTVPNGVTFHKEGPELGISLSNHKMANVGKSPDGWKPGQPEGLKKLDDVKDEYELVERMREQDDPFS